MRRLAAILALAVVVLAGCMSPEQQQAFDLVNASRTTARVPLLAVDEQLSLKAQLWAMELANRGALRHSRLSDGVPAGWRLLAENVGSGDSVGGVHASFLASKVHRANLLDGRYTHAGTGVAARDGRVYVVQVFARYQ